MKSIERQMIDQRSTLRIDETCLNLSCFQDNASRSGKKLIKFFEGLNLISWMICAQTNK